MPKCKICGKDLKSCQKSTCSIRCRGEYVRNFNTGKPSPFKGVKNRWTIEQRKKIGDAQRGTIHSEEFKKGCSDRMRGIAFFKGHHQSEKQKAIMRSHSGKNHYNYQGKDSTGSNKGAYNVKLRRIKNGWTQEMFDRRLEAQNNKCAICNLEFNESVHMLKKTADHCHSRNIARGIICKGCNVMLGFAKDNVAILGNAIRYLTSWE